MNTPDPHPAAPTNPLERLEQFLRLDPGNPLLLAETADAALAGGAYERAQQLIDTGLALPGDPSIWRFRHSSLYIAQRRLDEAHQILSALLQEGGKHPVVAHNLAYIELLRGDFEACLRVLQPWIDSPAGKDDGALQILWLRALHRLDRVDEAWQWAKPRRADGSLSPAAAGVASLVALDVGDMEAALDLSQRALEADIPPMEALVARASVALAQRDAPCARELLEAGLKLNPQDGRAWSTLAFTAMLEKQLGQAQQLFEKALRFGPDHIETWHGLGWTCVLRQNLAGAAAAFESALRLDPQFGENHGALAVVKALQGQDQSALEHVGQAIELEPSNMAARYAQALLSGEAGELEAFQRLTRRFLGKSRRRAR